MSLPKRYKVNWINLALALLTVYFCYLVTDRYLEMESIRRETSAVRQQLEQANTLNQQLQAERDRLLAPSYIEKLAREQLGLVKPGEMPYIPSDKK